MSAQQDKQYMCVCGGTKFEIFTGSIKCSDCGEAFNYYHGFLNDPKTFNNRRQSLKVKKP